LFSARVAIADAQRYSDLPHFGTFDPARILAIDFAISYAAAPERSQRLKIITTHRVKALVPHPYKYID